MPISGSKIFCGYRAAGFSSNHVPLVVRYNVRHKDNYVVTCVGKSFHTYNCSKLGLVSVSDSHACDIECMAVDATRVFTACKNKIFAFNRGKHVEHSYVGHESNVHILLPFGNHLLSVDEKSCLKIWDIEAEEEYLELKFENASFQVSALVHPNTYLNKILIGSKQGSLQLWNIHTSKLIYTFPGWGAQITILEQAPAVDVIAVGHSDGQIVLHNIRYDETLMKFTQEWGPVTAISFRTDGHAVMVTGSTIGHVALWDLEKKRLLSQIRDAHHSAVSGMKCLPCEPLMVTSSADNSLKVWIFDQPDGGGRLLNQRTGHSAPPNKVRFHDRKGHNILSAGQDSTLQSFSTVHDSKNRSLGRASYNKKESKKVGLKKDLNMMPPITDFTSESSRQSDWDSIVACHRGCTQVTTWDYNRYTMGKYRLQHQRFVQEKSLRNTTALCTTISSCGNFCCVGYSSGHVDVFNLQSGLHRGYAGNPVAHDGAVRGLAIDGLNQLLVSAGADKCVKFWKFKHKELVSTLDLAYQISKICLHRDSSMLAVALDDFSVVIVDIDTRRVVRTFTGHRNCITDMCFSPDCRWLITTSMDSSVRTWDLPTGRLVDCFLVDAAVTSIAISPTGEFLATTHVDDLGIYLWSNMTLYHHTSLHPLPSVYEPVLVDLPTTSAKTDEPAEENEVQMYQSSEFKSPQQIADELVTLSLLPTSRWLNLLNLDTIKKRNKPKEPPKVPKAAPFFIPTIPGLQPKFDIQENEEKEKFESKVISSSLLSYTAFGKLVEKSVPSRQYGTIMAAMKEMSPSAIDIEIRSLAPLHGGSVELMVAFIKFLNHSFTSNKDFELIQAYLGLFLKVHGETIASEPELIEEVKLIVDSQSRAWKGLQIQFNQSLCLINYLKSATV
ncbi:WD repeat-containing protein 36-like [Tubulanus polymorphus]|uniref:WD repeat-containing protein 36-like n=1 Tax=Tubulanus polymorphus TaxID=672921 RepID=UPI003DA4916A